MQLTARSPLGRARVAVAVTALAALVVILGGAFSVAGLLFHGNAGLAAVAAGGTFAAYFVTSRTAFDALDRLGDLRERRAALTSTPTGELRVATDPTRLAPPAQDPGRHRPETFARTHHMPAVVSQTQRMPAVPAGARP